MVFFDDSNNAVGKIFATDLQGFDLQVNNDGEQLVVTGSEYTQRVLTTGMEFFWLAFGEPDVHSMNWKL